MLLVDGCPKMNLVTAAVLDADATGVDLLRTEVLVTAAALNADETGVSLH
jgi:hypothetical protein